MTKDLSLVKGKKSEGLVVSKVKSLCIYVLITSKAIVYTKPGTIENTYFIACTIDKDFNERAKEQLHLD